MFSNYFYFFLIQKLVGMYSNKSSKNKHFYAAITLNVKLHPGLD